MTSSLAAALLFAPSESNALLQPLIMFPLIFLIFYFVVMGPQRKQRQQHEEALRQIKRGDEVVTAGGIVGEVVHIKETVVGEGATARPMEDQVTIRSAESRLVVERGKIARIIGGSSAPAATKE